MCEYLSYVCMTTVSNVYLISCGSKEAIRIYLPQEFTVEKIKSSESGEDKTHASDESEPWKWWKSRYPDAKMLRMAITSVLGGTSKPNLRSLYAQVLDDDLEKEDFEPTTASYIIVESLLKPFTGLNGLYRLMPCLETYQLALSSPAFDILNDIDEKYKKSIENQNQNQSQRREEMRKQPNYPNVHRVFDLS